MSVWDILERFHICKFKSLEPNVNNIEDCTIGPYKNIVVCKVIKKV